MATKAKIAKAQKQAQMVAAYADLRRDLKAKGDWQGLAKLPKDAHPARLHHRDLIDGRPRAYMRKFGMSRIHFREMALKGQIPGVRKASW